MSLARRLSGKQVQYFPSPGFPTTKELEETTETPFVAEPLEGYTPASQDCPSDFCQVMVMIPPCHDM